MLSLEMLAADTISHYSLMTFPYSQLFTFTESIFRSHRLPGR